MRTPNYKVAWLIQNRVAALTHFHTEITQQDIMGVFEDTQKLLQGATEKFHIIVDNRFAPLDRLHRLEELQSFSPFLKHPLLSYLIMVKPKQLALNETDAELQFSNGVCLKNVSSVKEAFDFLYRQQAVKADALLDAGFFPS